MVTISHPKTPLSLNIFSSPTTSSSSLTSPMKLKTIINTLICSHIRRLIRALSKAKNIFLELFRDNHHFLCLKPTHKKEKHMKKVLFGSFRLHYNWCSSSHVMPFPSHTIQDIIDDVHTSSHSITISLGTTTTTSSSSSRSTIYYDSTWNSIFETDDDQQQEDSTYHDAKNNGGAFMFDEEEGELSRYLQWLEQKGKKENLNTNNGEGNVGNEIDKLADMFIASCHEKFRLEKIESYRRYQENMLLARSM